MRSFWVLLRRWFSEKNEINYLYFSIFFFILSALSLSHFLFWECPVPGIRLFFLIYAAVQAFLEVWVFIFVAYSFKKWAPKWVFFSCIAFSFVLLLIHFTDFTLLRLMDASVSYVFKFFFGRGVDHLLTALQACNMNLGMLGIIGLALLCLPFIGLLLYWVTNQIARLNPWSLSPRQSMAALFATGTILFFLEAMVHPYLERSVYNKHHKNLPLGVTFLAPAPKCIHLTSPIAPPRSEEEMIKKMPALSAAALPNIYLFVIETLRRDFVNQQTAPFLLEFAGENINFSSSYANANWTPLSWFAIFHSNFPFNWASTRDSWKGGSIPLRLLKQLGYKICVYSSADLRYFNMDRTIFGQKKELADRITDHFSQRSLQPFQRDGLCIESFARDLEREDARSGNLYVFFLDATHSEYSFPEDAPLKFEPIAKQIDYLTLTPKDMEPVKNRYRNAISFIDSLMGRFFGLLKEKGLYDSAVITITGDHGEEFYEEGAFFHGTHLNRYQTEVPIFCKFPGMLKASDQATHIDILPSILQYIAGGTKLPDLFDGSSIFSEDRNPYRIAVLQNGPDTPVEFSIEQGDAKIQMRLLGPQDIYSQTAMEVTNWRTQENSDVESPEALLKVFFSGALDQLLRNPK